MNIYRIACLLFFVLSSSRGIGQYRDIDFERFPWPDPANSIVFELPKAAQDIQLDGQLDESSWAKAGTIRKFYSSSNAEKVDIDAKVSMFYYDNTLIFGFDLPRIKEKSSLKKSFLTDEYNLVRSPAYISILLDPGHEHGVYYQFVFDQQNHKQDLRVGDDTWSTDWSMVSKVSGDRWKAEIRIPLSESFTEPKEGDVWGFNLVLKGLKEGDMLSATPIKINLADAEGFGHLLFTGNLNKKDLAEIRSSLPEIHQSQRKSRLDENKEMCGPEFIAIPDALTNITPGEAIKLSGDVQVKCAGLDNPKVIRSKFPFYYEKYENAELQRLRKLYRLDEIVASGKNEFEQILLLNEWLVEHVPFGSPPPMLPQGHHVLNYGLSGQTYFCTYLSFTLMQMYISLGLTARKITSVGHGTLDVWSNYWGKWMQIDPSRNSYFRLSGTAIPLNSNEIRREYWRNGGVDMEMVFGTEQRAEKVTLQTREKDGALQYRQEGYAWIAYKTRNNFFEIPFTYRNFLYLIIDDEYNHDIKWMNGGEIDEREIFGIRTNDVGDIFWTLNQAHIHLYDQGAGTLKVQLETVTPNFDTFEMVIDEGEWIKSDAVFNWPLHTGLNVLKARSVNKFGVYGHEHKVVLVVE